MKISCRKTLEQIPFHMVNIIYFLIIFSFSPKMMKSTFIILPILLRKSKSLGLRLTLKTNEMCTQHDNCTTI